MKGQYIAAVLALLTLGSLLAFSTNSNPKTPETLFGEWKSSFGINSFHTPEEEVYRFKVFQANLQKIESHNSNPTRTWDMGLNQFSILTSQEFTEKFMTKVQGQPLEVEETQRKESLSRAANTDIDWRARGVVSPVKDLGSSCRADYAFAVVAAIEAAHAIASGRHDELSNQQMIDCSRNYGNAGCGGGNFAASYKYAVEAGLDLRVQYPYVGH